MMTRPLHCIAILSCAALLAGTASAGETEPVSQNGEAELAQMLQGHVADGSETCLGPLERRSMRLIEGTAIVFDAGGTIYVNRPEGARFLDEGDLPVFESWSGNLCRNDRVILTDRSSLIPGPHLRLNNFQAYRQPDGETP